MRRALALVVGGALLAFLVSRLPAETFGATQAALLVAAGALLLWVALALFVVPARRALARAFVLPVRVPDAGWFGMPSEPELRPTLRPLAVAAVALGVATAAALLR